MKIKVKYFGMIAEKIGASNEVLELDSEGKSGLRSFFEQKYPDLVEMNFKIAVNQEFTDIISEGVETAEVALLPPFAGG